MFSLYNQYLVALPNAGSCIHVNALHISDECLRKSIFGGDTFPYVLFISVGTTFAADILW